MAWLKWDRKYNENLTKKSFNRDKGQAKVYSRKYIPEMNNSVEIEVMSKTRRQRKIFELTTAGGS